MGNTSSTSDTNIDDSMNYKKFNKSINTILTSLLKNDMESYLNKTYCKKLKFFIKNEFFMKQSETILENMSDDIFIGEEVVKEKKKTELCDKLTHHFLKKNQPMQLGSLIIKFL